MPKKNTTSLKATSFADDTKILRSAWDKPFGYFIGLFLACGITVAIGWYKYQLNPDAISYISIAKSYAHLDVRHAVNGYWSPLLSWILTPFVWLHINLQLASKFINLLASTLILCLVYGTFVRQKVDRLLSYLALSGLALLLLNWTLAGPITPDLLFVSILLLECILLVLTLKKPTRLHMVLLGCSGALLYFSKAFGIYVFCFQILACFTYTALISKSYRVRLFQLCTILGTTLILVAPWVGLISLKYHRVTLSTASSYNLGLLSPQTKGQPEQPMDFTGPFAPPNSEAISVWEDPSFIPVVRWSPFSSRSNFVYFLSLFWSNFVRARDALISFGALVIVGLSLLIGGSIVKALKRKSLDIYDVMFISAVLLVVGYSFVWVEDRYIWAIAVFAVMAAIYQANILFRNQKSSLHAAGVVVLLGSFWLNVHPLVQSASVDHYLYAGVQSLSLKLPTGSNVLTNDEEGTGMLSYYGGYHSYGLLPMTKNPKSQLKAYDFAKSLGAQYYLYNLDWQGPPGLSSFLAAYTTPRGQLHYREGNNKIDVAVYQLK